MQAFPELLSITLLAATLQLSAQSLTTPSSSPPPQTSTITTGTQLVVVDVVIQDHNGNPVLGLNPADFHLIENKQPQAIKTFDMHNAVTQSSENIKLPNLPPGTFTDRALVPEDATLNVLLLDTLNTPVENQVYVRNQLKEYIRHATPGTRIAIFGLTHRLILLQGFTSDPEVLKAVVDHKLLPGTSVILDDPLNNFVLPDSSTTIDKLSPHNSLIAKSLANGLFRAYDIAFNVQASDIALPVQPDGKHRGALEFMTYVYDNDGKLLNVDGETLGINLTPEDYDRALKSGVGYRLQVSAPAHGDAFLRIGVHDLTTNHLGVVEVPTTSVALLSPAPPASK